MSDISHPEIYQITAAQLTVDGEIKHGQFPHLPVLL
jgi:hypothetical protein